MAAGSPKQDQNPFEDDGDQAGGLFAEINITPFTDVILVLLIIFMVTSSAMVDAARDGKLDVTLPSASTAATQESPAKSLVLGITKDGRLYLEGKAIAEDELSSVLASTKAKDPQTLVIVQADGELHHKRVVEIIDLLRETGFSNVGIGAEAE